LVHEVGNIKDKKSMKGINHKGSTLPFGQGMPEKSEHLVSATSFQQP
jgi:hypothetical protein